MLKNVPEEYGQKCVKISLSVSKQPRISILEGQNTVRVCLMLLGGGGGGGVDLVSLLVEKMDKDIFSQN